MRRGDLAFLGLIVALFLACVVRDPRSDELPFRSFHPLPDAIEYAVGAASLNAGRGLMLTINGHPIPSRYPLGFPLVVALCYRLLGDDIANAYWVSVALGASTIPLMFCLALAVTADRRVARWSAFFFATSSLILSFATLVMSEMCSVCLALLALNLAVNKEGIVQKIFHGYAQANASPVSTVSSGYAAQEPYAYDVKRARVLLAEAGWKDAGPDGVLKPDAVLKKDGETLTLQLLFPAKHYGQAFDETTAAVAEMLSERPLKLAAMPTAASPGGPGRSSTRPASAPASCAGSRSTRSP